MAIFPDNPDRAFQSGDKLTGYSGSNDYSFPYSTFLDNYTTSDLAEGTGLYYTDERVDDRVNALITAGDFMDKTYVDGSDSLTLDVNLSTATTSNISESTTANEANQYMWYATGVIDHSDILSLNSIPITMVAGETTFLVCPVALYLVFDTPNVTGYTSNDLNVIESSSGNTLATVSASIITGSAGRWAVVPFGTSIQGSSLGGGIQLQADTADPTSGDASNTLTYHIKYVKVDFA